jgi:hypothetical protein
MLTVTIKDIIDGDWDKLDGADEPHCIYIVRDGDCILYVGQSVDIFNRLLEHFGHVGRGSGSGLGSFYDAHQDISNSWQIDLYTLSDCEPYITRYTSMSLTVYRNGSQNAINKAEKTMMRHFHPCLNTRNNPDPSPLPDKYLEEWERAPRINIFAVDYLKEL